MAQSYKGKTAAKKSTAAKKGKGGSSKNGKSGAKNKQPQQTTLTDFIFKQEFKATVIFVFGLLLTIVMLFAGGDGSFWNKIHLFYFSITGLCGYYIPLAVLFFGVVDVMNKQNAKFYVKAAELLFLLVIVCGFIHINLVADEAIGYGESIKQVYHSVVSGSSSAISNGGVIGAVFGGALFHLSKSVTVANIINAFLAIGDLMLLFGITLFKLFSQVEKPAKKVTEYTGEAIEKRKTEREKVRQEKQQRKNPDVDPAQIVDDFCQNNPDAFKDGTTDSVSEKDDQPGSKQEIPVQQDMFSAFDRIGGQPDKQGAVDHTSPDAAHGNGTPEFVNLFEQAEKANEAGDKQEKLPPLSEKESAELNQILDDALTEAPPVEYHKPPLECLNMPQQKQKGYTESELRSNGEKLIAALNSFNVSATIVNVVPGPTVTRYELSPAPGVKISKFVGLSDDLALHMAAPAGLRIEAPIPNKAAIGIEIPNRKKTTVTFREIIDTEQFRNAKSKLNVALGKDIAGDPVFSDLAKMPHLLVAGTTGSGKSVCLNTMIVSLLYNASPDEVKILLIDPKQVEFGVYNGLPHLLVPVVSDPRKASGALGWAVTEMLSRYKTLNANGVRDISAYNSLCEEREDLVKMPQIVIFIDELSDLMTVAPAEVEDSIQRLAQMARAAGMHLVVATQRPSVDVITGVIKANIPSRIALTVKSQIDSRTIIDSAGAEKLMGYGDMLYYPVGVPKPIRVQGSYLTDMEIENVVSFIKANGSAAYDDSVQQEIDRQAAQDKKKGSSDADSSGGIDAGDDLVMRAIELFVNTPEKASISALQRHLSLGFAKAGRLMDTLEEKGIVGPHEGSKPRKVLITKAQWYEMNAMSDTAIPPADGSPAEAPFDGADE